MNPSVLQYRDADGDGYGDPDDTASLCDAVEGYIDYAGDCNDSRPEVNPEGREVCDPVDEDEDCNGLSDDADTDADGEHTTFYQDADGDGYGSSEETTSTCDLPGGYSTDARDCDDTDTSVTIECTFIDVAASGTHSCAIRGTGLIECWGTNDHGESTPPDGGFVDIDGSNTTGNDWSCGIRDDGTLACWGADLDGLGLLDPPEGTYSGVSVGRTHACAIDGSGQAVCWGSNTSGEADPPNGTYASVSAGILADSAGILADGSVVAWGDDSLYDPELPGTDYVAVGLGSAWLCALDTLGWVACVGAGESFDDFASRAPTLPTRGMSLTAETACAMYPDDAAHCWREGGYFYSSYTVLQLDTGSDYVCTIRNTGALHCFGSSCPDDGDDWCAPPE